MGNYSLNGDDFQYLYCKISQSFRCYFEHIKYNNEIAYLISKSSQNSQAAKRNTLYLVEI